MKHKVFVYGTLRTGYRNHCLLDGAKLIGDGMTLRRFRMVSTGGFPVALAGDRGRVRGEVYEVDSKLLTRLDRLEGEGVMYKRRRVVVLLDDAGAVPCLMYIGVGRFWRRSAKTMPEVERIDGGLYLWNYRGERRIA